MRFNKNIVISTLNRLGVRYNANKINNNWMAVICPLHNDKDFGNANVNLDSGVISCFNCHQSISIIKMYMDKFDCTFDVAKEQIFGIGLSVIKNYDPKPVVKKEIEHSYIDDHMVYPFDPNEYTYTKLRGYTKEYCETFGIKRCFSSQYLDYIITPIEDEKLNVHSFEARKLCLNERIKQFCISEGYPFNKGDLTEYFKKHNAKKQYKIKDNVIVDIEGRRYYSQDLFYILKSKVLYPSNSGINRTIFNRKNLDLNKDLWVSEGLATHPKLYKGVSKNSTSIFGSKVTDEQIKILKEFKERIIIISDWDEASFRMILLMNQHLDNIWISLSKVDDTDNKFIESVNGRPLIKASAYVLSETIKKENNYEEI